MNSFVGLLSGRGIPMTIFEYSIFLWHNHKYLWCRIISEHHIFWGKKFIRKSMLKNLFSYHIIRIDQVEFLSMKRWLLFCIVLFHLTFDWYLRFIFLNFLNFHLFFRSYWIFRDIVNNSNLNGGQENVVNHFIHQRAIWPQLHCCHQDCCYS